MWNISSAKSRFSELLMKAKENPQLISNRGKACVVVLEVSKFEQMKKELDHLKSIMKKQEAIKLQNAIRDSYSESDKDFEPSRLPERNALEWNE